MKKFNLIIGILSLVNVLSAQVSYSLSPNDTVNLILPLNQNTASKIYQVNTGSSKILLKWERVFVNLPVGWTYTSCDNSFCYGGVPLGPNVMDSVSVAGQGFVGVDIDPANITGVGIVKIYVYQDGYYSQGDTLTWNISTTAVGINEYTDSDAISMYPNPANDLLHIDLLTEFEKGIIRILNYAGSVVVERAIDDLSSTIDVSKLSSGAYFLQIESSNGKLFKRFVKH